MRTIEPTNQYKRDWKRERKTGHKDFPQILDTVIEMLQRDQSLPGKYRDHELKGEWKDHRECHVKPDLLLIYRKGPDEKETAAAARNKEEEPEPYLILARLGSHSELFG